MEKKGNGDTFRTVYFVWVGLVLSSLRFRLQHSTGPTVPLVGRFAIVPLFRSHTHSPIDRMALRWPSAGARPVPTPRYLPWTTLPRPGPATLTVHAHTDVHALTSHGTVGTHMGRRTTGRRTHAHTRRLRVPCGPLRGLALGQRAYAAARRCSPPSRAARARNTSCSRPSRC